MKRLLAVLMVLALAMPFPTTSAPDESQKLLIQRAQEAKQKLSGAQAASGAEREKMMQEHMKMMQNMMAQMQKAKPGAGMTPEQKGEWMDEHMKLMHEMMGQMMGGHRMMMDMPGMGMGGMGGKH